MDVFDPYHICNHTDQEGRYAYKVRIRFVVIYQLTDRLRRVQYQPNMMYVFPLFTFVQTGSNHIFSSEYTHAAIF